ncbi:hypothetical protein PRR26_19655, partial [Klebsiella pneumoniae]|nr:hypothetical protein [Klebsiella pneumoniae]
SVCKIWMETTVGGSKLAILLGPGRPKSRSPASGVSPARRWSIRRRR